MKDWVWKGPAWLLAMASVALMVSRTLGVQTTTTPIRLDTHIKVEDAWHARDAAEDSVTLTKTDELHQHIRQMEAQQNKVEGVFFTEQCLENTYEMLAAQRMLATCDSLGIHRQRHDEAPASVPPP